MKIEYQVETPVAFLVFKRPDTTAQVFAEISKVKPKKLLIVADGPNPNRQGESERCAAVRSIVERVDWDCEVLKNYSEMNLGCKRRISSGLDWVFGTVDRAIVLEDDVVPHPTFFRFCDELLEKYADDERIGAICGTNMQNGIKRGRFSYYFSRYNHVWGWASWARAWKFYDVDMLLWPMIREEGYLRSLVPEAQALDYWAKNFHAVYEGRIDTWDYQWIFACWANNMLAVLPQVNLASNIGFSLDATHTDDPFSRDAKRPTECMTWPLIHPDFVMRNELADAYTDSKHYHTSPHWTLSRIRRLALLIRHGQFRVMFRKIGGHMRNVTRGQYI